MPGNRFFDVRECGVTGNMLVSKISVSGSNPGTPVLLLFRRSGRNGDCTSLLNWEVNSLCGFESRLLRNSNKLLWLFVELL